MPKINDKKEKKQIQKQKLKHKRQTTKFEKSPKTKAKITKSMSASIALLDNSCMLMSPLYTDLHAGRNEERQTDIHTYRQYDI